MSNTAAAAKPSTDPTPEIFTGSRSSGSLGTSTVAVPPGSGWIADGAVVTFKMAFEIPPTTLDGTWAFGAAVVADDDAFFDVVLVVALLAVVAVAAAAVDVV